MNIRADTSAATGTDRINATSAGAVAIMITMIGIAAGNLVMGLVEGAAAEPHLPLPLKFHETKTATICKRAGTGY